MIKIAPSIASADQSNLAQAVELVESAGADWLHFDIEDGVFIPNLSFGPKTIRDLRAHTSLPFDVHLEVDQPESLLRQVVEAGANIVTVQYESTRFPYRAISILKGMGVKAGLAFNAATAVEAIQPVLDELDVVLLMMAEPEGAGADFMPGLLGKIEQVRDACAGRAIEVEVDGGIHPGNAGRCVLAGATVLVAGRAIWGEREPAQAIARLRACALAGAAG